MRNGGVSDASHLAPGDQGHTHPFASGDGFVYLVSLRGESEFWELVQISYLMPEEQR